MKMLIKIGSHPADFFFVTISSETVIRSVKSQIKNRKFAKAIIMSITRGEKIKKVTEEDLGSLDSDLILTENQVYYDVL